MGATAEAAEPSGHVRVEPVPYVVHALCEFRGALALSEAVDSGSADAGGFVALTENGWQLRLPLPNHVPARLLPGELLLEAKEMFSTGEQQRLLFRVRGGALLFRDTVSAESPRAAAQQWLRLLVEARRLESERPDGYAGWVCTSPLGACWTGFAEEISLGHPARLCKYKGCRRPFLSRRTSGVDYCSATCRTEASRARIKEKAKKAPRRGRRRK